MKKFFFLITFFLCHFEIAKADSFLLISSPESYVTKENFFASGDGVLFIQQQIQKTSQIQIMERPLKKRVWFFQINPKDELVKPGLHKFVLSFHQAKSFGEEVGATLEMSFSTDSRSSGRYIGFAKVHEARYTLGKNLRGLAIDVLFFGDAERSNWNYIEIRQNSKIPHTFSISKEKIPSLEEIEKLLK